MKPRIDILLVVTDSADEAAYIPALEAAGYNLTIRESGWYGIGCCWAMIHPFICTSSALAAWRSPACC